MIPHHTVTGPDDAPVLVLSNSLGTTLGMWDPQAEQLAEPFRLVAYDTRGHLINVERPDDVTRLILDHLEG